MRQIFAGKEIDPKPRAILHKAFSAEAKSQFSKLKD
jgi:hypothetical protein